MINPGQESHIRLNEEKNTLWLKIIHKLLRTGPKGLDSAERQRSIEGRSPIRGEPLRNRGELIRTGEKVESEAGGDWSWVVQPRLISTECRLKNGNAGPFRGDWTGI